MPAVQPCLLVCGTHLPRKTPHQVKGMFGTGCGEDKLKGTGGDDEGGAVG